MSITTRQTSLLVNQDWKKVYQSFKEADFQSYDFETLRKTMIDYLRTYYPEDFNDFTESSEYIALIDLIAFLGQSLAFRTDLNTRENFIDTAERRDSILKLARLVSYNPKRNVPASGLLKIDSISTTESITDSNGLNLSNLSITWNDTANPDWLEQFTTILNAALVSNQVIGNPGHGQVINGVQTDEYAVNLVQGVIPTYSFAAQIEGSGINFEAVSATSLNESYVYEASPAPSGRFNMLYRNDNLGNGSINTGYFVYFKQGTLATTSINLQQSLPNRQVSINYDNINNTDLWLYELDANGTPTTKWTQIPAVAGINVIYNKSTDRNLFQVNSRANDQIDLVFGDGSFSNIPQGVYKLYYRTSNGLSYKITPDEMQGITIPLTYVSRSNRVETITLKVSLHYTVANATERELIDDIRVKAPQQYYTQNRMITGEDYNLFPYTNFNSILKVKAVNRTSSGISRYLDVLDATGKYSSTNIFASDGWLYADEPRTSSTFTYSTVNDINNVIYNTLRPILTSTEVAQFYYAKFRDTVVGGSHIVPTGTVSWEKTTSATGTSTGYFTNGSSVYDIGLITNDAALKYITVGALLKFTAGTGNYFDAHGVIQSGTPKFPGDRMYIYAKVLSNLGTNVIRITQNIPTDAVLSEVVPVFNGDLPAGVFVSELVTLIQNYKTFGIRYDIATAQWQLISAENLRLDLAFSLVNQGVADDSSWVAAFLYDGTSYRILNRSLRYMFESLAETRFYFDPKVKVYDSKTGLTIHDQIKVLGINAAADTPDAIGQDQTWYVYDRVVDSNGYVNDRKVLVTFTDSNNDGSPDDPDLFTNLISADPDPLLWSRVFFKFATNANGWGQAIPVDNATIVTDYTGPLDIEAHRTLYADGQVFYTTGVVSNAFYVLSVNTNGNWSLTETNDYIARIGRQQLYFQHRHNSPNNRRIDPSPNNLMDLYIITKQYSDSYLQWIQDTSNSVAEPEVVSSDSLKLSYGSGSTSLDNFKALSDTIVYNPGKYKPVFGAKAAANLQAVFKVVKNPNVAVSDNDIKTSVIAAINTFFDPVNWDFGETFYFSELSTYLHNTLAPNIASIIIVPNNDQLVFGDLMQINADPDEIIISAATVDNVEIIPALTAVQLRQTDVFVFW